jgi:probable rRNA maturation factor
MPPPRLSIQQKSKLPSEVSRADIRKAILATLKAAHVQDFVALTLIFGDDALLQSLNLAYRGIDAPTDVLSFPADDVPPALREEGEPRYLGDMFISLPYSLRRAQEEGHSAREELFLLTVHGVLHLCAYDHDTPARQAEMWAIQARALHALNVHLDLPPYIHA